MASKAKIRPIFTVDRCRPLRLTDRWEDDYGSGDRYKSDYCHARRAFLSSYKLVAQNDDGFKEKMERRLTEFNGAALDVMLDFKDKVKGKLKGVNGVSRDVMASLWKAICKRKRRITDRRPMRRIRLGFPSRPRPGLDCLAPWWIKLPAPGLY